MFVDSHCHLDFQDLAQNIPDILERMRHNNVTNALVVSVSMDRWEGLFDLVDQHEELYASVGVHPDYEDTSEPTVEQLVSTAEASEKIVAIGETGLDYFRKPEPLEWQRERFRTHIRASRASGLPLIIHTRAASDDTLRIMREEGADEVGGVMHCFTESWDVAQAAMDLGFYISLSGIVTFKNATDLQEVARLVPMDRLLIETDSPFLAPVPYRGKTNDPSKVLHVAQKIAELKQMSLSEIGHQTTDNFFNLFNNIRREHKVK